MTMPPTPAQCGRSITTGENLHSLYEFQHMLELGDTAFSEPDLVTLDGVTPRLKVAHACEARNRPITTHGVHDLHVHLLAAIPNASYPEAHDLGLEPFPREEPLSLHEEPCGLQLDPDTACIWTGTVRKRIATRPSALLTVD